MRGTIYLQRGACDHSEHYMERGLGDKMGYHHMVTYVP
jgi:hypothetical protein